MEDRVLFLFYMVVLNGVLCVGCLVADYIFPHIPFIKRYLESLPNWDDKEEVASTESTTLFVADEFSELTEEHWRRLIARLEGKKMAENYYETPKGVLEILWQDGYHAAARLIERLQSDNRAAEFEFMRSYVAESCFDDVICRDRLRMLWTAYCLHHDLDVDTAGYDNDLLELWNKLTETGDGTSEWADYDGFDNLMCAYLV